MKLTVLLDRRPSDLDSGSSSLDDFESMECWNENRMVQETHAKITMTLLMETVIKSERSRLGAVSTHRPSDEANRMTATLVVMPLFRYINQLPI